MFMNMSSKKEDETQNEKQQEQRCSWSKEEEGQIRKKEMYKKLVQQ